MSDGQTVSQPTATTVSTVPNPALLVCDADALFQLFISNSIRILLELKRVYGIQPSITTEVELELRSVSRYAKRIDAALTKALNNKTLVVITRHSLSAHFGSTSDVLFDAFQKLGDSYRLLVGAGEAYTHAAAATLKVPALSHDTKAVAFLLKKSMTIGSPTLRAFDLIAFGLQTGILSTTECENFRKSVAIEGNEYVPKEFQNTSFDKGISAFSPRLYDSSRARIGAVTSTTNPAEAALAISPKPAV